MFKKLFGILCLVIGLVAVSGSLHNAGSISVKLNIDSHSKDYFFEIFRKDPWTGVGIVLGLFFFAIGVLLASKRTASQRRMEYEYEALKQHYEENAIVDVTVQIEKLARLKEKGLLTEEEFREWKGRLLG